RGVVRTEGAATPAWHLGVDASVRLGAGADERRRARYCAGSRPGGRQRDKVKAGQILVILEAMKMENEIVAPKAGTVAQVVVKVGEKVDTGATLVVLA
ncbi:MAG: acetyl-CoA carboxylase biotin carboxyl carrier protein subunit, partial [Oscillospiraceae bacterium]|nr:acetyl-CoA carboxylase biotin carboxyl carrier protein subunit [Oscillospiraceae bacterium]